VLTVVGDLQLLHVQRDGSAQDAADNINFLRSNNVPAAQWKVSPELHLWALIAGQVYYVP
jgi:hypothetical protein